MPDTLSFAWVKNVYSLRTQGGIKSGHITPTIPTSLLGSQLGVYKPTTLPRFNPQFASLLSTLISRHFNLLINHLYPLSTTPIIKKKKER